MKILTLNINSIRAHIESFLDLLEKNEYDTILVQELKVDNSNFPFMLFDEFGYNIKIFGQKSWNGVAIFSKHSIEEVSFNIPNYPDTNSRVIECVIDGRIRIINTYMPNGDNIESPKFAYKLDWMRAFTQHIKQYLESPEPVIIAGDFNVAITDNDIWNPRNYIGSSISAPAAREIMQSWLNDGWTDAWRELHPQTQDYTWYGYRGIDTVGKKQGLRLDYFLCNKTAKKMVKNCEIDLCPRTANKPTDHCGLMIQIN